MKASQASNFFFDYHKINSKKSTLRNYDFVLNRFCREFGDREAETIGQEEILTFLNQVMQGSKQPTKRLRYSLLRAFFNFIINSGDQVSQNPCDSPILRKIFKDPSLSNGRIWGKKR